MKKKRAAALLLCCVMLIGLLAGCGKEEQKQESIVRYVPEFREITAENINGVSLAAMRGEDIYFVAYVPGGTNKQMNENGEIVENPMDIPALFHVKRDGTGLEQLTDYQVMEAPEDRFGSASVQKLMCLEDGTIVLLESLNTYYYELPEDFVSGVTMIWDYYRDGGTKTLLRFLNPDGTEQRSIDLSAAAAQANGGSAEQQGDSPVSYYIYDYGIDPSGNIYFFEEMGRLFVLDASGAVLFSVEMENGANGFVRLNDGRVAVVTYQENPALTVIDPEKKALGEAIVLPGSYNQLYTGAGDYLYFFSTASGVGGVKADGTVENLLTWVNCDVAGDGLMGLEFESGEKLSGVQYNYENQKLEIVELEKREIPPEDQAKIIRMAVMWQEYTIRNKILEFNRANNGYRIELEDYSVYNTNGDWNAGKTKLMTEIASGKIPDIMDGNMISTERMAAKGILEDLLPLIAADTEIGGEEAFLKPVLEVMKIDGHLYELSPFFAIRTAVSNPRLTGGRDHWTTDEVREILKNMPEGSSVDTPYQTQTDLLRATLAENMGSFVNWETGECKFNTPDFVKLLEFSMLAPKEISQTVYDDWETYNEASYIPAGRQLMASTVLYGFYNYFWLKAMWGDDMVAIGRPTETGTGHAFEAQGYNGYCFTLSAKCAHKEGAWQFIRSFLLDPDTEMASGFPILKAPFEQKLQDAMTPDENVEEYAFYYEMPSGEVRAFRCLTEADRDLIMGIIENTTKMAEYDEELMNIIMDEAQGFIDGKTSAQDAANMIQSRVNIYVNEQR